MLYSQYRLNRMAELVNEQWGNLRIPGLLSLIQTCTPRSVLEIGSYQGVSTELFLLNAETVYAVDPWPEIEVFRNFLIRVGSYPNLTVARGLSPAAVPYDREFDLVYIDGDHSYDAVRQDIVAARKVLKDGGGWVGGHDYAGRDTPDVQRAVRDEFPGESPFLFADSSWLIHC